MAEDAADPVAPAPVRGRQLAALRACGLNPLGLRIGAYPSAMPILAARGLVEELPARWQGRRPKETGRFLTEAGREMLDGIKRDRNAAL